MKEWHAGSATVTRTVFNDLVLSQSLFVTTDGTIYVDNGWKGVVEKWAPDANESVVVMNVTAFCSGLFVDIVNNLYCSLPNEDRVEKQSLTASKNRSKTIVAGSGLCGSKLTMLCSPRGIFVTVKFDLYVADCHNNRIQLFRSEKLTGKTVVGTMVSSSIKLSCPTGIVVDTNNYLFIVDSHNNRIIRSNSNEFYCVVGCSIGGGSASDRLGGPSSAAFDNAGNILVVDRQKSRVQKFLLMTNRDGM